jgi:hypothetical protein
MINILIVVAFFLWRVILFKDSLLAATELGRDGLIPAVLILIWHHFRFRLSNATTTYTSLRHHHLLTPVIMFSVIL